MAVDRRAHRPRRHAPEQLATVAIEGIAAGGDGVGRVDGLACFVPRTAPGDVVQVAYAPQARFARGRALQWLERSPERVEPACVHYDRDRCGGCQLQHLAPEAQRRARVRIVADALARIGHRRIEAPPLVAGARAWGYRARLTLTLARRGRSWAGGLHPYDDPVRTFALAECPIAAPSLVAVWRALQPLPETLPAIAPGGPPLRLALRLLSAERVAVVVQGGRDWREAERVAATLAARSPLVGEVWWEEAGGRPVRLHPVADRGMPASPVALAFAQVNPEVAGLLRAHVRALIEAFAPTRVVDGYAGVGDLALALAGGGGAGASGSVREVVAVERDPAATATLRARLAERPPGGATVHVETAAVEAALPGLLPADVVVLNPPRRGVDPAVTALLDGDAGRAVRGIVYVSCDPATLARDLARLPRWRLAEVTCFDLFPQTAHVETVCVLVPEEDA